MANRIKSFNRCTGSVMLSVAKHLACTAADVRKSEMAPAFEAGPYGRPRLLQYDKPSLFLSSTLNPPPSLLLFPSCPSRTSWFNL